MARKYETVDIDDLKYELHGVKVDTGERKRDPVRNIQVKVMAGAGSVPVRMFGDGDSFADFTAAATPGELTLIVDDWKYGCGVRLQGMVRKAVSGDGYTELDHNRIFNELSLADPKWLVGFAGKGDALDKACRAEWERQRAENPTELDAKRVWSEFASTVSAEVDIS